MPLAPLIASADTAPCSPRWNGSVSSRHRVRHGRRVLRLNLDFHRILTPSFTFQLRWVNTAPFRARCDQRPIIALERKSGHFRERSARESCEVG